MVGFYPGGGGGGGDTMGKLSRICRHKNGVLKTGFIIFNISEIVFLKRRKFLHDSVVPMSL